MTPYLDVLLALAAAPVCLSGGYLLLLTLLSGAPAPPPAAPLPVRFRFIVPAHDEEQGVAATVQSLLSVSYPRDSFDVLVVADNCSDETARRAREAGALVIERTDPVNRGKGYALHHAFELLPAEIEAVVVIDADTSISSNLLQAFAARLADGAGAVQADYAVRNARAAWRTRLMAIALGSFHVVRSRARERLGVSCGLRGNGMCFRRTVLQSVPHQAYSIVEDVEYGIRLAEAGHRVHYVDEAHVYGDMVVSAQAAVSQRQRWEGGRAALARRNATRLLRKAWSHRDPVALDLLLDILVPPLSRIALAAVTGLCLALVGACWLGSFGLSLGVWAFAASCLVPYVLRGWSLSGTGARGLLDLAGAPFYVVWKLTLRMRKPRRSADEWIRTTREPSAEVRREP